VEEAFTLFHVPEFDSYGNPEPSSKPERVLLQQSQLSRSDGALENQTGAVFHSVSLFISTDKAAKSRGHKIC